MQWQTEHVLPIALLLLALVFWAGFMTLALRGAALPDEATGVVAVVFPLQRDADAVFNAIMLAEGRIVTNTWLDTAWIVQSDQPGFVKRLKDSGAWAVFKPSLFQPFTVGGCFFVTSQTA